MLTGRAAELRPDINDLKVTPIVLVSQDDAPQPAAADGEFAGLLRAWARTTNVRRMQAARGRNSALDVPTSGPERRRAKAHRNRGLCLERTADGRCPHDAVNGTGRCGRHAKQEADA